MSKDEPPYEVGYGKPPRSGQFEKGKSGNPKGRPKGSPNLAMVVLRESRQRVRVNGPRGSHCITKVEAAVMQLANKAAQGDLPAQREYLSLVRLSELAASSGVVPQTSREIDQRVLQNILERLRSSPTKGTSTSAAPEGEEPH
jgi:hypothetical protein